jgi:hypothetical protein
MRVNKAILIVCFGSVLSLAASIALLNASEGWSQPSPIAGDAELYGWIAEATLSGAVPYTGVAVEHFPVLLIPILLVGIYSSVSGVAFAASWPLFVIGAVVGSVIIAGRITVVPRYQWRVAVAMVPMLPLILYRLEIFVVAIALASIASFAKSRMVAGSVWSILGSLAKGWPIVLLIVPLRRGSVRTGLIAFVGAVVMLGIVASLPGFQQGRTFSGLHSETLIGNALLLVRYASGSELGLIAVAGARYVSAPGWAVALNAVFGLLVGAFALRAALSTNDLTKLLRTAGLSVVAIILVSPLFSAQFAFWLVPFVPLFARRSRITYGVVALMSMLIVAFWNPVEAWWSTAVLVRNLLFVTTAILWVREIASYADRAASRR